MEIVKKENTKRVAVIITYILRNVYFEWHQEMIDDEKVELHYILLNPKEESWFKDYLVSRRLPFLDIRYRRKKDIALTFFKIYKYLIKNNIDVVETHFHEASFIGIPAAWLSGVSKRVLMRRASTYNLKYHQKGLWIDKLLGKLATHLIAISPVVAQVLEKIDNVPKQKIHLIYHGFKAAQFENINSERVKNLIDKYALKGKGPVIGVISRFIEWKGVEHIIQAFKKLRNKHVDAHLVLANAGGPIEKKIKALLLELPASSYTEIYYESDIFALYKTFDLFVHVPIDPQIEAFGRIYVEALLSKIPSIFTISGIAHAFIEHKKNAMVVDYKSSDKIYVAMMELLNNKDLREKITIQGYEDALQFSARKQMKQLENLYLNG